VETHVQQFQLQEQQKQLTAALDTLESQLATKEV